MTHTHSDVVAMVHVMFDEPQWQSALEILASYGIEDYEREIHRVQIAILKLSEGDMTKLKKNLASAKRDYRDVLFWSEYPEQSRLDTPEKKAAASNLFAAFGLNTPKNFPEPTVPKNSAVVNITPEKIKEIRELFKKQGITPPKDFPT